MSLDSIAYPKGDRNPLHGSAGWTVYVLRCADDSLYTGITNDLDRRLALHEAGTASKYTRSRRPVTLAYTEGPLDRSEALRREQVIKRLTRRQKLRLLQRERGTPRRP